MNRLSRYGPIALIALATRIPFLFEPAWYDEYFTLWLSRLPFGRMMEATMGDVHPPLWYALAWVVEPWGGLIAIRAVSLLFGLLAIWLAWLIYQELAPGPVARIALLLMVLSPFQVMYSTEGRMYALLLVCVLAGVLATIRGWFIGLIIAIVAGIYTHNLMILYAPALWALWAWYNPGWPKTILIPVISLALYAPWLPVAVGQLSAVNGGYWVLPLHMGRLAMFTSFMISGPDSWLIWLAVPITFALLVQAWPDQPLTWLLAFGPVLIGAVISWIFTPVLIVRPLIGSSSFLYLLLAQGGVNLASKWGRGWAGALIAPVFLLAFALNYHYRSPLPVPEIRPGDQCYHLSEYSLMPVQAIAPDCDHYLRESTGDLSRGISERTKIAMGMKESDFEALKPGRIWLFWESTPLSHPDEGIALDRILSQYPAKTDYELLESTYVRDRAWLIEKSPIHEITEKE